MEQPQQPQIELQQFLQNLQAQVHRMEGQLLRVKQATMALHIESRFFRAKGQETRMPIEFISQFGEDILAWSLFEGQLSGFFIEAGAFDGYHHSPTYALEAIGWNGLLVEAIPERARQCAERRKFSRTVHGVLGPDGATGDSEFWIVDDPYGGMCSYRVLTSQRAKDLGDTPRRPVQVPRVSLNALMKEHAGPVDLLVLDLEGDEVEALKGFDLRRYRPRVMLIEENTGGRDPALKTFMGPQEYKRVARLGPSEVFIRNDETVLFERLKWLLMPGG